MIHEKMMTGVALVFCSAAVQSVAFGQSVSITEFPVPTLRCAPMGITSAADGSLRLTEYSGNKIARMTPTGLFTEYAIPTPASAPEAITTSPDGYVWFTEHYGRKIGRISQAGGPIAEFSIPGIGAYPTAITTDPAGRVWFASNQQPGTARIGWISSTGAVTLLPAGATLTYITGIVAGPDGNLWVTQTSSYWGDSVAKVTTAGWGSFMNCKLANHSAGPKGITVGPDGNLWFTESNSDKIGRITTGGVMVEFGLPTGSRPQQIVTGPDGDLWFTEPASNQLGQMTTSGQLTEQMVPMVSSQPFGISRGPDGHLYFTEKAGNQVAVVGTF
jgi:virginiamycin B lyase